MIMPQVRERSGKMGFYEKSGNSQGISHAVREFCGLGKILGKSQGILWAGICGNLGTTVWKWFLHYLFWIIMWYYFFFQKADQYKITPLLNAIYEGHTKVVELLISKVSKELWESNYKVILSIIDYHFDGLNQSICCLFFLIKSPQYTGGDFMFLYRFVRRRRPQILVHAITFEQLLGFLSFLAQLLALTCRLPD